MIEALVIGEVWATRKHPLVGGAKLLLVAQIAVSEDGTETLTGRTIVVRDRLDARIGDRVLVSFGSGARNALKPGSRDVLADAATVQVIEGASTR